VRFSNRLTKLLGTAAAIMMLGGAAGAVQAASIEGTWRTLNGTEISVDRCGDGYCGLLSWIVIPKEQSGMCKSMAKEAFASLMLDYNNADQSLQSRPLLGVEMLKLKPTKDDDAYTASIYNAEDGKTYDVLVWVMGGDTLRLGGGCLGSMCAVTQDWPRVPERPATPDFTCDGGA
jgi:uncharacterized protein (DUF2147 family)